MFVLFWLYDTVFSSSKLLVGCFAVTLLLLTISGIISWRLKQSGYTLATGFLSIGTHLLLLTWLKIPVVRAVTYLGVMLCTCALAYGIALACVNISAYLLKRKQLREKIERAVCYTLPARENEYVRNRLHTVLQEAVEEEEERLTLSFSYVSRVLVRLQNAKLSLTERLETEGLAKLLSQYKHKQSFTTEDVLSINEAFSKLMKLSAKYGVAVKD